MGFFGIVRQEKRWYSETADPCFFFITSPPDLLSSPPSALVSPPQQLWDFIREEVTDQIWGSFDWGIWLLYLNLVVVLSWSQQLHFLATTIPSCGSTVAVKFRTLIRDKRLDVGFLDTIFFRG
ncbi:uncharacterized protein LOC122043572 [Zingiber officinale]|uniref:uncharacterized protein LOC122043572 n=1 Tax=Zingiber officinale TaxID=94328 RepID=UPI001C4D9BC8|nr:uncharacterized protein LOC122043572 [Zingiber officinale]